MKKIVRLGTTYFEFTKEEAALKSKCLEVLKSADKIEASKAVICEVIRSESERIYSTHRKVWDVILNHLYKEYRIPKSTVLSINRTTGVITLSYNNTFFGRLKKAWHLITYQDRG